MARKPKSTNEDVGYGKPPKANQFKPGSSGNPKGRPKGSRNIHSIILSDSRELVVINGPKGPRSITKFEAVIKQLGNQAAKGNLSAVRFYVPTVQASEFAAEQNHYSSKTWMEADLTVLENLKKRLVGFVSDVPAQSSERKGEDHD